MSVPAAQIARRCRRRRAASARPRPRPLGDRPSASAARPRPAARDASYQYYVIDNLVDEARRQGACRDA
eukprot:1814371-Prymnesium_polylepis.1